MSIESKMALTVDFLREFIEAYRNHVALWKVGSKEYVDKALKKAGYDELINKCWEFNIAADREFVVRKINSLRGAFRKEHNKVLAAASRGQKYLPVLWYYKLLLFTSDKDVPEAVYETESPDCKPENDYKNEIMDEMYIERNLDGESTVSTNISKNSDEITADVNEQDKVFLLPEDGSPEDHLQVHLDYPKDHIIRPSRIYCRPNPYNTSRRTNDAGRLPDEFEAIGLNVAAKLRRMDENQRFYAELLLTKVLGMGLLCKLSENTVVYERNVSPYKDNAGLSTSSS